MTFVLASTYYTTNTTKTSTRKYGYNSYKPRKYKMDKPENIECAPVMEKPTITSGSSPDDGCGDYSVRFKSDGKCYPLMKQGPCDSIYYWVTVDPKTFEVIYY